MGSLYSEQPTWLHAVPAYIKLLALAVLGTGLFMTQALPVLLGATLVCVCVFASLGGAVKPAKPLLLGVLLASVLVAGFHVWLQHAALAVITVTRLVSTTLMGVALTVTTRHSDVLHVLERLLSPLHRLGLKPDVLALQVALMLRFTEHFFVVWRRLDEAYRLRTGQAGGFKILAPLTIHMLIAARRVADTLYIRFRR